MEKGKRFVNLYSFSSEVHGIFEAIGGQEDQAAFKQIPEKEKEIHNILQVTDEAV